MPNGLIYDGQQKLMPMLITEPLEPLQAEQQPCRDPDRSATLEERCRACMQHLTSSSQQACQLARDLRERSVADAWNGSNEAQLCCALEHAMQQASVRLNELVRPGRPACRHPSLDGHQPAV